MNEMKKTIVQLNTIFLNKSKAFIINHKKKVIAFVLILIAGYWIKKKMTMGHVFAIGEILMKIVKLLPLPQQQNLREISKYEHPKPFPLKGIFEEIKLDDIKERISKKEGTWDELKESILTGTVVTLTLYNINYLYFVVVQKYMQDFKELKALDQFQNVMNGIRKSFTNQIPVIFKRVHQILKTNFDMIDIKSIYNHEQLNEMFTNLTDKLFQPQFYVHKQYNKSIIGKSDSKAINYFNSQYQYKPAKEQTILSKIGKGVVSIFGFIFGVFDCLPDVSTQITSKRYQMAKNCYMMSLYKCVVQGIQWPNETSRQLFSLVFEQISYILGSLNFSVLLREYCNYNKKILMNRIKLWFISNKSENTKMLKFLPALYKILKQQFYKNDIYDLRRIYHEKQLKRNIRQVALQQNKRERQQMMQSGQISLQQDILSEILNQKSFEYLQKEFELKYFYERSGIVHTPRHRGQQNENKNLQDFLGLLSNNDEGANINN